MSISAGTPRSQAGKYLLIMVLLGNREGYIYLVLSHLLVAQRQGLKRRSNSSYTAARPQRAHH